MIDKLFATWWAIACGYGLVDYLFNQEERPWSFIGALIYFLLFLATIIQIKTGGSVLIWFLNRRKKRKADEEKFWNRRVADEDI